MLNDLYAFVDKLKLFQNSLTGTFSLSNIEDNINVTLSGDGLGHVEIKGILLHTHDPNLKTEFVINSDQTFLPELIRECDQILEYYQNK